MNRPLIWIIAGVATLTVAVPTIAAARDAGTPDDNGVPGELRGNCDEAEHAADPACISVEVPTPTPAVTTPASSVPASSVPSVTMPSRSVPSNTVPSATVPGVRSNSIPSASLPSTSLPGDISGPCDEAEHANESRCTGVAGPDIDDDGGDHDDVDDDRSGHGGGDDVDDDRSGHGGGDDVDDDDVDHDDVDDDRSGHGGGAEDDHHESDDDD